MQSSRMMRNILYVMLALLIILGIAFAAKHMYSKSSDSIPTGKEAQREAANTIRTIAGMEFVITLEANATTGYEWQIAEPVDNSLIKLLSSDYVPYKTSLVGSGGRSIWVFKAIRTGKAHISFKYVRSWEKDVPPVKTANYIIDIKSLS